MKKYKFARSKTTFESAEVFAENEEEAFAIVEDPFGTDWFEDETWAETPQLSSVEEVAS